MAIEKPDRISFLEKIPLFHGISTKNLLILADKVEEHVYNPDELVIIQGEKAENIFLVYEGNVKGTHFPDDSPESLPILSQGSYFGDEALTPGTTYANTFKAIERTSLLIFSSKDFDLLPTIPVPERIAFLQRIHLFTGLDENQLDKIACVLDEKSSEEGSAIVKEGEAVGCIYLIHTGKVRVTKENNEKPLATLVPGDYFGEESVLGQHHHQCLLYRLWRRHLPSGSHARTLRSW
jgi:CRP-like cAMP-binding protein